jgi:hypothetical protein
MTDQKTSALGSAGCPYVVPAHLLVVALACWLRPAVLGPGGGSNWEGTLAAGESGREVTGWKETLDRTSCGQREVAFELRQDDQ